MRAPAKRADLAAARYVLMGSVAFLTLLGLVMIYSSSLAADAFHLGDSAYHLKRQLLHAGMGLLVLLLCSRLSIDVIRRSGWGVLIASDIGLIAVMIIGVGKWGATRWLDLGFINLQPSEFAKLGVILTLAALLADRHEHPRPWRQDLSTVAWIIVPTFALVMAQPDMGTAMTIAVSAFFLLVLGGVRARYLWAIVAAGVAGGAALIAAAPYRASRFMAFVDPWADPRGDGYQSIQGLIAFGSGGLTGVGLGLSRQKFFYLPAAHTDFIFAIIGEELGLAGTLAVVVAFGLVAWAGIRIALSTPDRFSRLLAGGLTVLVVAQAAMNMAAVTGLMPVTGIPLPLMSSGGSSVLFTLGCVGLILSVATNGRSRAAVRKPASHIPTEEIRLASAFERRGDRRPRLSSIDGGRAASRRRA